MNQFADALALSKNFQYQLQSPFAVLGIELIVGGFPPFLLKLILARRLFLQNHVYEFL